MKELYLQQVADFSEQLGQRELVTTSTGPNGEALVLAVAPEDVDKPFARRVQEGWASFPQSKVSPYRMSLLSFAPEYHGEITLQDFEESHPHIQPLPNDEILVVAARCDNHSGTPEQNATIYGPDGLVKRRFVMGDGIQDVQVTNSGDIWTSYFDEGVFGNFGWNDPLGAAGLLKFNADGEVLWRFEPQENCDFIADCYAMNVARDATWLCYYTEFPIARINSDGSMRCWHNTITGAHALVTDNQRVLLFGGYSKRNRCVVQEFGNGRMVRAREIKLILPDNENNELPERVRAVGRGSTLHLFIETAWYQLDLAEVDA